MSSSVMAVSSVRLANGITLLPRTYFDGMTARLYHLFVVNRILIVASAVQRFPVYNEEVERAILMGGSTFFFH